ncbi:MAG TPA: non-canonical purine NTP pyrophosphatase [Acidobacteriaceae bacterium]
MVLYAATTNPGKLAEFATSASAEGIQVVALPGLASLPEPVEDAETFIGNAEIKAIAYSLASPGLMVFADDSGLEVNGLDGAPGVRSARYAEDQAFDIGATEDARNNNCLLANLAASGSKARTSRFVCALALARDGEILLRAEGTVEGEILHAPRGDNGFGYDPLFLLPDFGLTMAELGREQKWELSHRGNAFRDLLRQLRRADL